MQKYTLSLLSAILGMSAAFMPLPTAHAQSGAFNVAYVQHINYIPSKGKVVHYRGTRLRYYPNHVIVADYYNERVIRNIVALSQELGWDTVYLQVPPRLRGYTTRYFIDNDLDLNYFSVNLNPDDTIGLFYGAGGFGYSYNNRYYSNHHHRHDRHHHDRGDRGHRRHHPHTFEKRSVGRIESEPRMRAIENPGISRGSEKIQTFEHRRGQSGSPSSQNHRGGHHSEGHRGGHHR